MQTYPHHPILKWEGKSHGGHEAVLGKPGDGVRFTYSYQPTCYRRGKYKILIEVFEGPGHHDWGCFDEQDQPVRYYHDYTVAMEEADRIAWVLIADRFPFRTAHRGNDQFVIHANGLIGRPGEEPSGEWQFLKVFQKHENNRGVEKEIFLHDLLLDPDAIPWKFADGSQRSFIYDIDHGTYRTWINPGYHVT